MDDPPELVVIARPAISDEALALWQKYSLNIPPFRSSLLLIKSIPPIFTERARLGFRELLNVSQHCPQQFDDPAIGPRN